MRYCGERQLTKYKYCKQVSLSMQFVRTIIQMFYYLFQILYSVQSKYLTIAAQCQQQHKSCRLLIFWASVYSTAMATALGPMLFVFAAVCHCVYHVFSFMWCLFSSNMKPKLLYKQVISGHSLLRYDLVPIGQVLGMQAALP